METLRDVSAQARKRIAAEREARLAVESKVGDAEKARKQAEEARDRAEKSFEGLQQSAQEERERMVAHATAARKAAEKTVADARGRLETEVELRVRAAGEQIQAEADRRDRRRRAARRRRRARRRTGATRTRCAWRPRSSAA